MTLHLAPFAAALPLLFAAAISLLYPGRRPRFVLAFAEGAAISAFAIALGSFVLLLAHGSATSPLVGAAGIGFSARLDAVSVTMLLLAAFVGWIVIRFSRTYLDGEARQGDFTGWLCLAIAAVLLLVQAGNLAQLVVAWIGVSFYRPFDRYRQRRQLRSASVPAICAGRH